MQYQKLGLIFKPDSHFEWMYHYAGPVSCVAFDDFIRVYFSTRSQLDAKGHFSTRISFLDCDKKNPLRVLRMHDKPLLPLGAAGTFDEHGTMVAEVIVYKNKYYMYYMGWQRSDTVPYIITLGLAVSDDGENFTKTSEGPVIGLNRFLPLGIGNVSVLLEDGLFHMWYTHYCPWIPTEHGYRPNYDIRYASSLNGFDWHFGKQCIVPSNDNEALATPCVRKINGTFHMWYSYRPGIDASGKSGPYRIGYARSADGQHWQRADKEMTLGVAAEGWDSEMVCYPDVLQTGDAVFLFYCGNSYGKDGFGCAQIQGL